MDIVLISPGGRERIYQDLAWNLTAIETPVWCGLIASFLQQKGHSVAIIDANAEGMNAEDVAKRVAEYNPTVACVVAHGQNPSASTQCMPESSRILQAIAKRQWSRNPTITTIMGGHPAALPERTLKEEDVDLVITGEGPHALHELLKGNKRGVVSRVPYNDEVIRHAPSPNVEHLDKDMPGIAWDLLPDVSTYRSHNWQTFFREEDRSPYAALYTTLGCPYSCAFCHPAGTRITMADMSKKNIEDIVEGDRVIGRWYDGEYMSREATIIDKVTATASREVETLVSIRTDKGILLSTEDHPIPTENRSWQEASNVLPGDRVKTINPDYTVSISTVESMTRQESTMPMKVYNFRCEPSNTYFANGILVHNCMIQAPFKEGDKLKGVKGNSYRKWSPERIVSWMDYLVRERGVRTFKFADEMFVLHKKHVEETCRLLRSREYAKDINIWAYARVDTVKDGWVPMLREAGWRWLALGVEAASAEVRDSADKGYAQDDIMKCVEEMRKHDMCIIANYIFGLPGETKESMQATYDLSVEICAEYNNYYAWQCFPGSPLYFQEKEKGRELPTDWNEYAFYSKNTHAYDTGNLTGPEVLRFRDEAFQLYYNNPDYLRRMEEKFGTECIRQIRAMTEVPLVRSAY